MLNLIAAYKDLHTSVVHDWEDIRSCDLKEMVDKDESNGRDTWIATDPYRMYDIYMKACLQQVPSGRMFFVLPDKKAAYGQDKIISILDMIGKDSVPPAGCFSLENDVPIVVDDAAAFDLDMMKKLFSDYKGNKKTSHVQNTMLRHVSSAYKHNYFAGRRSIGHLHISCEKDLDMGWFYNLAMQFLLSDTVVQNCRIVLSSKLLDSPDGKYAEWLLDAMHKRFIESMCRSDRKSSLWTYEAKFKKLMAGKFIVDIFN